MEKHTAKIFCLSIVLVLVADILGQTTSGTLATGTLATGTEAVSGTTTPATGGTTPAVSGTTPAVSGTTPTMGGTTQAADRTITLITTKTGGATDGTITMITTKTGGATDGTQTDNVTIPATEENMMTDPAAVTEAKIPKQFVGTLKITHVDGEEAKFTDELTDPTSDEFMSEAQLVCKALIAASEESSLGAVNKCNITSFTNGSIVAAFSLNYEDGATLTATKLKKELENSFENSNNSDISTFTVESITVEETTTVVKPTEAVVGLSTGAIAGIAAGSAVGGLLLIVLLVCAVMKCKGGSSKVSGSVHELKPAEAQDAEAAKGDDLVVENK